MNTSTGALLRHGFNWHLVRSFLAVLDHGTLQGAARTLRTSQPTVGRHIAELESQLGVVLFERSGRGLAPTALAHQLAEAARAMEAGALQLERQLSGAHAGLNGTVRITTSAPVAVHLMPGILAQLHQALPEIQVELVASNQVSNLLRREADIAVRMVRPDQASLVAKKIGDVALCVCASQDYLQRKPPLLHPTDLFTHDLIGSDHDTSILDGFRALGFPVSPQNFHFRSDDFVVQWQAVRAGLGIGFMAEYMLRSDPSVVQLLRGKLRIAPLPMWLAVHREIRTSQRIRAVYDFLAAALPARL